jgi:glyoxylase I family protein
MTCKSHVRDLISVILMLALTVGGCRSTTDDLRQTRKEAMKRIRLEHIALNVEDPVRMADWYCRNLGMKILKEGPPPVNGRFIADAQGNMMLEVYTNPPDGVPDYRSMNPLCLHIAFMVDDEATQKRLLAAGATLVEGVSTTPAGDQIAMLRDPWGVPIQFVRRSEPMLSHR